MIRVAHILPALGYGGVEVGIKKSHKFLNSQIDYRIFTCRNSNTLEIPSSNVFVLCRDIFRSKWRPEVIVTSLWYAHVFGYILSQICNVVWVPFFHNTSYAHRADKFFLKLAWKLCVKSMADSVATKEFMERDGCIRPCSIVPYVFSSAPAITNNFRDIDLIWVGRDVPEKRLDFFASLSKLLLTLDDKIRIVAVIASKSFNTARPIELDVPNLEVLHNISNECVNDLLQRSKTFILTSEYEGMSMTTVEAIQNGCVPITTKVGEIPNYTTSESALYFDLKSEKTLGELPYQINSLLKNSSLLSNMQFRGSALLDNYPNYVTCFLQAIYKFNTEL